MLIPFPFAFLTGAAVADALAAWLSHAPLATVGGYLAAAGIATALVAAVPGFIDYLFVVPPESSGKTRATRHMLCNLSAVALFAAAVWLRGGLSLAPSLAVLAFELAGVGLLFTGGWLGGTLVYRNQISVDHRYANAGKWREQSLSAPKGEPMMVATEDELDVNQMKLLRVDDKRIVLARTEDGYVAFDDRCTHKGGPLSDGAMICGTVQCPWHGSQFNARTGAVEQGPAEKKIGTYKVTTRDGEVRLTL